MQDLLTNAATEPNSILGNMFSEQHSISKQNDGSVFIDPDGTYFRIILDYLRGTITSPDQLSDDKLLPFNLVAEVNNYHLQGLKEIIKPDRKNLVKLLLKKKYSNLLKQSIRSVRHLRISHLKKLY